MPVTQTPKDTPKSTKGRFRPKGRMADATTIEEVLSLLPDKRPARDQLIEMLHIVNDHFHHLSSRHLAALAQIMRLPLAEIWEVASFYDHFTLVRDNQPAPPARSLRVCTSLSCMLAGSHTLLKQLKKLESDNLRVIEAPCLGACDKAPALADGHSLLEFSKPEDIRRLISQPQPIKKPEGHVDFDAYRKTGGYALVQQFLNDQADKATWLEAISQSGLRGLGGAGFPTGHKWQIVSGYDGQRLMAVNGDEGEPGTFKDRLYLSTDPHRMIEGMLIAAWITGIEKAYIYIRDEYPEILALLKDEVKKVQQSGLAAHLEIEIRRGAGAYVCGEESAMIESIEGKRGLPRHRPPYVAECGLFGRPTLVNNVETLYWVRDILENGADWFASKGKTGHPGMRSYSVSGRVARPAVITAAAGTTANELIAACGGMAEGHKLKAYLPGGASGGILPASKADIALDFGGTLADEGCFVGSHAVVILSDRDDMWQVALNLMQFFKHESCGQCTPCRNGTQKAVEIMDSKNPDTELLKALSSVMADASICGLGQAASNPLVSVMRHFPEDIPKDRIL